MSSCTDSQSVITLLIISYKTIIKTESSNYMHGNFEVIKLVFENGVCDVKLLFPIFPTFDHNASL